MLTMMKLSGSVLVMMVVVMLQQALDVVDATSHQMQKRAIAELLVDSTLKAIETDGLDVVLGQINNLNNTRFRDTEDVNGYVVAFANNGTCLAHGQRPGDFVGRTTEDVILAKIPELKDKLDGWKINTLMVEKAQAGGGWVTYNWITPTGVVYEKNSLVKQPKDYKDMYVLSGYDVTTPEDVAPAPDPKEE